MPISFIYNQLAYCRWNMAADTSICTLECFADDIVCYCFAVSRLG